MFTRSRRWTASWAKWIHFTPNLTVSMRSTLILSFNIWLGLPNVFSFQDYRLFYVCNFWHCCLWYLNFFNLKPCGRFLKSVAYECVSKSFRTGCLERELQMVQLSATRCSCIAILWVSLVSFAAITLCVASQRVFIVVVVYLVIDSVRKLLDIPMYIRFSFFIPYSSFLGSTAQLRPWPPP
jgi:hypothetical protein